MVSMPKNVSASALLIFLALSKASLCPMVLKNGSQSQAHLHTPSSYIDIPC